MLSEQGLSLLKGLLTYDPKKGLTCEQALRSEYFREDPRPIDPSMFPTWPAKSEQEPGDKGEIPTFTTNLVLALMCFEYNCIISLEGTVYRTLPTYGTGTKGNTRNIEKE